MSIPVVGIPARSSQELYRVSECKGHFCYTCNIPNALVSRELRCFLVLVVCCCWGRWSCLRSVFCVRKRYHFQSTACPFQVRCCITAYEGVEDRATLLVIQLVSTQRGSGSLSVKIFFHAHDCYHKQCFKLFSEQRRQKITFGWTEKTTKWEKDILFINIWLSIQLPPSIQLGLLDRKLRVITSKRKRKARLRILYQWPKHVFVFLLYY
jgi:hypothetical protein